jgi:hypothetical protein
MTIPRHLYTVEVKSELRKTKIQAEEMEYLRSVKRCMRSDKCKNIDWPVREELSKLGLSYV